jgi:hypothetical protein
MTDRKWNTFALTESQASPAKLESPGTSLSSSVQRKGKDNWNLEILMMALSFVCLAAIVIVLIFANGAQIQVWRGLTLNTLISALSTASKASVMLSLSSSISQWCWCVFRTQRRKLMDLEVFNNASRGPLGSFQLFWYTRTGSLIWIGAATTILAVAFSPFTQQLVQYDQKITQSTSSRAWVPRAERYSRGHQLVNTMSLVGVNNVSTIPVVSMSNADFSMQLAVCTFALDAPTSLSQILRGCTLLHQCMD